MFTDTISNSTRTVIRGESENKIHVKGLEEENFRIVRGDDWQLYIQFLLDRDNNASPKISFIDWLSFSIKEIDQEVLRQDLIEIFNLQNLEWTPLNRGWQGFTNKIELGGYGFIAHGGQSQKGIMSIQLRPEACRQFKNINSIFEWAEKYQARITRVDLTYDDFEGQKINIKNARKWDKKNLYTTRGRKPKTRAIINNDKTEGDSFYAGKRQSGKQLNIYEKGKQLGDTKSKWNRLEVRLFAKDRLIPWDVIKEPGKYLAATYPCFNFLSEEQCSITTAKKAYSISYDAMVENGRIQFGKTINAMLIHEEGDIGVVIDQLRRDGIPSRLSPYKTNNTFTGEIQ